ncbi:hypothetical protein GCM10025868_01590 [Angustibacter aerolatus]|uniref:Peptidase M16 N-terminal domain-containing protein n=1 Tax=Angustibacter aerolatus TaxID=1162965 RepID=A0ABQ6JBT2_9ACTN|nr:hypothetical protein GCM10025868_01590 [Angustibacter aerolatus]
MTEGRWIAEPLHRTEIDGVPVLWRQGPGPLQASLVVRTGLADETFTTNGLTHLVEHLVMRRVGPRPIEVNASVGLLFTEFTATGSPAAVASFVTDVCGVLRDVAAAEPADLAGDVAAEPARPRRRGGRRRAARWAARPALRGGRARAGRLPAGGAARAAPGAGARAGAQPVRRRAGGAGARRAATERPAPRAAGGSAAAPAEDA